MKESIQQEIVSALWIIIFLLMIELNYGFWIIVPAIMAVISIIESALSGILERKKGKPLPEKPE